MMPDKKQAVVVTGAAGNLGLRLLPFLTDFNVVAVDIAEPSSPCPVRFQRMDLGAEDAGQRFAELLRDTGASAVVHLAFVIDPVRTNILDVPRMWQINVAGTGRVMDAIADVNREGGHVRKFIFPSSVSAYGPDLAEPAVETTPLRAHTLAYAVHKRESDELVQQRASTLGDCATWLLRPHIYVGATMQNYLVGVLRGTPTGRGRIAAFLRRHGVRLPLVVPFGRQYGENLFQFVHVDDVARLIAWIVDRPENATGFTILNVAGRGEPLSMERCREIARQKIIRLPGKISCRAVLRLLWTLSISGIPPDALPYMIGSYIMDTSRLQAFLGEDYTRVMRYTVEEALKDSFALPGAKSDEALPPRTESARRAS